MDNLKDLMVDQLREVYSAEIQWKSNLDKMAVQTSNENLRHAFEIRSKQIEQQTAKLGNIFSILSENQEERYSYVMEGIGKEIQAFLDRQPDTEIRDVGFIALAQKAKHYEIATYGALREFANELGVGEVEKILGEILQEEKREDHDLTDLARSGINRRAKESNTLEQRFSATHHGTKNSYKEGSA